MKKIKHNSAKKMYHLSPIENKKSILMSGLRSDDGIIFLFSNLEQAKHIACNQVGTEHYTIFEVDLAGIKGKLKDDNVAEYGSKWQFYVEQKEIASQFVKHLRDISTNIYDQAEECELPKYRILAKLYGARGKQQIEAAAIEMLEDIVSYNKTWVAHYNKKYKKKIVFVDINTVVKAA